MSSRVERAPAPLRCNICHTVVETADDLGFGYRGTPKVGDTHVCDRFQYGFLERVPNLAATPSSALEESSE
jgi:hypothetical protein